MSKQASSTSGTCATGISAVPAITPFDQACFAFAAYNAGPAATSGRHARGLRRWASTPMSGSATSRSRRGRTMSREPVVYVRNILKYCTSYRIFQAETEAAESTDPG